MPYRVQINLKKFQIIHYSERFDNKFKIEKLSDLTRFQTIHKLRIIHSLNIAELWKNYQYDFNGIQLVRSCFIDIYNFPFYIRSRTNLNSNINFIILQYTRLSARTVIFKSAYLYCVTSIYSSMILKGSTVILVINWYENCSQIFWTPCK